MSKQENLDRLVNLLQHRLQSKGKAKSIDPNGNVVYVDCDIYAKEMLGAFVYLSISEFNQTPFFSNFSLEDDKFVEVFAEILVEGAILAALASQALIERGREYQITDGGITFNPPGVSEIMNTQYSALMVQHWEKLKHIKLFIKDFK